MTTLSASFFSQNDSEAIYCISRTPKVSKAHVLFLQGLFEELNINRHAFTSTSILLSQNNIGSTIFDYFGTGDSQGESYQATLKHWHDNILAQIAYLNKKDDKPIFIIAFGSAALLINNEILSSVEHVQLWQPEVKGSRFIKKIERLELLSNQDDKSPKTSQYKEVAGYQINFELWNALTLMQFKPKPADKAKITWLECVDDKHASLSNRRRKESELWVDNNKLHLIEQQKYWLSTELMIPTCIIEYAVSLLLEHIENA